VSKLGFVVQQPDPAINPLLEAGPSILVCVESPGLIDSLKPLIPDPSKTLFIYRDWSSSQPLDDPYAAAVEKVKALDPVIVKGGMKYDGFELYNEIAQYDLDAVKKFRDFQLHCLDMLQERGVAVAVDNDSTRHPVLPQDWPAFWQIKSEVYAHPAAKWRCRHEYLESVYYGGGKDQWFRHQQEIEWLRANGKVVLPHYIGEWGWDKGPPIGPWSMGVGISEWIQGARDFVALLGPAVIGFPYFGAALDAAWPAYNLNSRKAPQGIIPAVAEWMKEEESIPDTSWNSVPEEVCQWYALLKGESFRLWPYQTIPYKGVELHGDRVGAVIIFIESGGDPTIPSHDPALIYNGEPVHAWGLMQVIPRIEGHPWFSNRPTIQELLIPATNIKTGMAIFHGSLLGAQGDLWEALRRYSGFSSEGYTLEDFWNRYGKEFQAKYKEWWDGTDQSGAKVAGGSYFVRLESGDFSATKRLVVVR